MNNFQKLINEYSEEYCLVLEATYSKGMMSEGETKGDDKNHLGKAGFSEITMPDENLHYATYNEDIVKHLKSETHSKPFIKKFGEESWKDAIKGYQQA